jgi:peptidoglycan/LPS O-acetylase OafA/YrhL
MKKVRLWKYSGIFLFATGILHTIVAINLGKEAFHKIIQDGLYSATSIDYTREFAIWFLICGIFIILLGQVLHHYIKKEQKPAPLSLGYSLLIVAIFCCIVAPDSGSWMFLPQALIIIVANKEQKQQEEIL